MPKLTDDGELDLIRDMYFEGNPLTNTSDPEEIAQISESRRKNIKNQAR